MDEIPYVTLSKIVTDITVEFHSIEPDALNSCTWKAATYNPVH